MARRNPVSPEAAFAQASNHLATAMKNLHVVKWQLKQMEEFEYLPPELWGAVENAEEAAGVAMDILEDMVE